MFKGLVLGIENVYSVYKGHSPAEKTLTKWQMTSSYERIVIKNVFKHKNIE